MKARFILPLYLGMAVQALVQAQSPGTFTGTGDLLPIELGYAPQATLLLDGRVLITGSGAEFYDPASRSFRPAGSTESWLGSTATRLADGRVLVAGGYPAGSASNRARLFDPATGTFTPTGNMTMPRGGHNAVLLANGKA